MLIARIVLTVLLLALLPAYGQTPKHGGILNAMAGRGPAGGLLDSRDLDDPRSLAVDAVLLEPRPVRSLQAARDRRDDPAELAEKWSWQDDYRNLVFFLRKTVRWHDGQPFTAKDVKYTFDVVREAKDAPARLRLNPRKEWYANIESIETPDASTVIFRLRRPSRPS